MTAVYTAWCSIERVGDDLIPAGDGALGVEASVTFLDRLLSPPMTSVSGRVKGGEGLSRVPGGAPSPFSPHPFQRNMKEKATQKAQGVWGHCLTCRKGPFAYLHNVTDDGRVARWCGDCRVRVGMRKRYCEPCRHKRELESERIRMQNNRAVLFRARPVRERLGR